MESTAVFQELIDMFNTSPVRKTFGMTLNYNTNGQAVFKMPNDENFHHGMGDTHGGVIMTLLDNAGWFTVAARIKKIVLTTDLNVRLLEPALNQSLTATGKLVRMGKKVAVAEMKVTSEDIRLIAVGSGAFAVTRKSI